mmetsp:Transcript_1055/g.3357  ORF Transcript_1055/g.3357 Transcript_1055/m.3357 type:complete len:200 (-) Transcript_1055:281-880(-)
MVRHVGFQVIKVDLGRATDNELQLLGRERRQQTPRSHFVEPRQEGVNLRTDRRRHAVPNQEPNVLCLVVVVDLDVGAARLQLDLTHLAKVINVGGKREIDAEVVDGMLLEVAQRTVVGGIDRLHVSKGDGDAQHVLVEGACEVHVKDLAIDNGLADDPSHELKVPEVLVVHVAERVGLEAGRVRRRHEQRVVRVEDLAR